MIKIVEKSDRYLMPSMQIRGEGRGNGVKTVIENLGEIAKALHRNPDHLTRFFGFELGSMSRYDAQRGFATINGTHTIRDLGAALNSFILRYLVCPNCGLPELVIKYPEPGKCIVNCSSCGHSAPLDMTHQIGAIIARASPLQKGTDKIKRRKEQMRNPTTRIVQALKKAEETIDADSDPFNQINVQKRVDAVKDCISQLQSDGHIHVGEEVPAVIAAIADDDILTNWGYVSPILLAVVGKDQMRQMYVLYSIELLVLKYETLAQRLSDIFYNLYMSEVVSTPVFFDWASDNAEPFVQPQQHEKNIAISSNFIKWLESDEEEEEEEGDGEYEYEEGEEEGEGGEEEGDADEE